MSKLSLSPSKINTFESCQLQFKYRYIDGLIKPPGIAGAIGTATHKGAELDMRSKLETGKLLPLEAVQDATRDKLENEWSGGVRADEDDMDKGAAIDLAVRLAALAHNEVAPSIAPVSVEEPFGVKVSDDIELTGHIDVREKARITDFKTIGKTPRKIKGDHLRQAQLYAIGAMVNHGELPTELQMHYLVKTKEVKHAPISEPMNKDLAQKALDRLALTSRVIARAMETGDFLPAPADHWACSQKWCGYFEDCPFGKRAQTGVRAED